MQILTGEENWTDDLEDIVWTEKTQMVRKLHCHRLQALIGQRSKQTIARDLNTKEVNFKITEEVSVKD